MSHTVKLAGEDWEIQKICKGVGDYELSLEKQKTDWECEQARQSWKWIVSYHGTIVSSGSSSTPEEACVRATENVPE